MFESIDYPTWILIKVMLSVGSTGLALLFAAWTAAAGYLGYVVGRRR
jgi:hypothetical protein